MRAAQLQAGSWTCKRCGLTGRGGLGHESAEACIRALQGRLQFSQSAYAAQQKTNRRLQEKFDGLRARNLTGGLADRVAALEEENKFILAELEQVKQRLHFVMRQGGVA